MRWTTYPTIPAATDVLRPRRRSRWHCDGKSVLSRRSTSRRRGSTLRRSRAAPRTSRSAAGASVPTCTCASGARTTRPTRCRCWSSTTARTTTGSPSSPRYSGAMIASGTLPPHRVALLAPGVRDEWYSRRRSTRARCASTSSRGCGRPSPSTALLSAWAPGPPTGCRSTFSSHLPSRCPLKYALAVRRMRPLGRTHVLDPSEIFTNHQRGSVRTHRWPAGHFRSKGDRVWLTAAQRQRNGSVWFQDIGIACLKTSEWGERPRVGGVESPPGYHRRRRRGPQPIRSRP